MKEKNQIPDPITPRQRAALQVLRDFEEPLLNAIDAMFILILTCVPPDDITEELQHDMDLIGLFSKKVRRAS